MKTIDISSTEKRIRAKVVKEYMERNGITLPGPAANSPGQE